MCDIIELLGGSGCGKSYLLMSDLLTKRYDRIFIAGKRLTLDEYKSRSKVKYFFLKCIFSRKIFFSRNFVWQMFRARIFDMRLLVNLGYKIALSEFLATYNDSEIILIEEGPTQIKYNMFNLDNNILKDLNLKYFRRHVILVKCNKETQLHRLRSRGHWRVSLSDMHEFINFNQRATNELIRELSDSDGVCSLEELENS